MKIIVLTNDNYFSFKVLKPFLLEKQNEISLMIFSSAKIGKQSSTGSMIWLLKHSGFRHTSFKVTIYLLSILMKILCRIFPFIPNNYSSFLWAKRKGMNLITTDNINQKDIVNKIRGLEPDLIVSVSMNQIVKQELLSIPKKRSINVHCAPLPKYRGMSPYVWVLANGEKSNAATIHYMEKGLDEGDIIEQISVPIRKNDSAFDLFKRCCSVAGVSLLSCVHKIDNGNVTSFIQDTSQISYFSWPDKNSIKALKKNGYKLITLQDIFYTIFKP